MQPGRVDSQNARQTAPVRRGGSLPYDFWRWVAVGVAVVGLGLALQMIWPNGFPLETTAHTDAAMVSEIHGGGPVRINELMSSNSGTLMDENGLNADWIEIMNVSGRAVDLEGYSLGKTEHATNVFTFPGHRLEPGEAVIVFADSTLRSEAGGEYHAPFRLSSQGGTLMLFNPSGSAIDSVNFPALASDAVYARQEQTVWSVSSQPTPGLSNTAESYQLLRQPAGNSGVEITEVVASNTKYAKAGDGQYYDYMELHNTTGDVIDLSGWFVSDSLDAPAGWRLPDGFALQPGEYRIVYCSGRDVADAAEPHASFGFSAEGEAAVLTDPQGRIADAVEFGLLHTDFAWVKQADGGWVESIPSPNAAN